MSALPATIGLAALLLAEVLFLTLTLDTQRLDRIDAPIADAIGYSPQVLRLLLAAVAVTLLVGRRALWASWSAGWQPQQARQVTPRLLFHLVLLLALWWTSSVFFSGSLSSPVFWGGLWIALAAATGLTWMSIVQPLTRWWTWAGGHRGELACGMAVGSAAWAIGSVGETAWEPMARVVFRLVGLGLSALGYEVVARPDTLELGTVRFSVLIAPECSGYEGVGLVVAFVAAYLYWFRREIRFPAALALLPIGAFAVWSLNLVRITALIILGDAGWRDVAVQGFHSQAGWITFNAVGLGLIAVARRGSWFTTDEERRRPSEPGLDTTTPYLAPFLALLAISMITGAFSAGVDWLYPVRLLAFGIVIWMYRGTYRELRWRVSWLAVLCGAAVAACWLALLPNDGAERALWFDTLQQNGGVGAALWGGARLLGYVMVTPIAEELAFRAYLTRRFWAEERQAPVEIGLFSWQGLAVSALVFGAFHGRLWFAGILAGVVFGALFFRRRSIGDAVLAHAVTNGLLAVYAVTTGNFSAWS